MARGVTPGLILSGPYCDLGDYSDVVHNHDQQSEISFSFAMTFAELQRGNSFSGSSIVDFQLPRTYNVGRSGVYFTKFDLKLPSDGEIQARLTFSVSKPFGPSLSRLEVTVTNAGSAKLVRTIRGERRQHWRTYITGMPPQIIAFSPAGRSLFPRIVVRDKVYERSAPSERGAAKSFSSATTLLFRYLQRTLWDSSVIGPFRTPPERRYSFGGFGASRGGPSGEQAVNLLITETMLRSSGGASLHSALAFWIKHLKPQNRCVRKISPSA